MIFVIIGITIAFLLIGAILWYVFDSDIISAVFYVIGTVGLIIALIACLWLSVSVSKLNVIDDMITMYQEENTKIEEQLAEVVKQYQQFETNVFTEIAPDSSMTLIALYPELKSDTLVQHQIEVYTKNNEQIKSLKERKINGNVVRWWLYFGDGESE